MLTPVDIENLRFKKTALGYSTDEVDEFLETLIVDYEKVFKDNVKLNSKIAMLEENLKRYDDMEETIKTSIMLAEKTAKETKVTAKEQAENILDRAGLEAEKLIAKTFAQKKEIEKEIFTLKKQYNILKTKMRVLLEGQLEMLSDADFNLELEDIKGDEEKSEPLRVPTNN